MLSIKILASILLVGHLASTGFIVSVLRRQWQLLSLPIDKTLRQFRHTLLYLSLGIFIGNLIPIAIDGLTLFVNTGRPSHVKLISILYALSVAAVQFISAYLIWTLYRLAANPQEMTDYSEKALDE